MGSYPEDKEKVLNVLVTGYDKFLNEHPNPSWLIAQSLPAELLPSRPGEKKINIHVRPEPLKVTYSYVREQLPPLLFIDEGKDASVAESSGKSGGSKKVPPIFDFVVLMGMAAGQNYYTMETLGHRDGYVLPGVDGERLVGDTYWKDLGGPEILRTDLNVDDVWRRWKENVIADDVRPSKDAGAFLCEFSLYTALFEYWRREARKSVTFMHVPGGTDESDLKRGRSAAIGLIRAIARSESRA